MFDLFTNVLAWLGRPKADTGDVAITKRAQRDILVKDTMIRTANQVGGTSNTHSQWNDGK